MGELERGLLLRLLLLLLALVCLPHHLLLLRRDLLSRLLLLLALLFLLRLHPRLLMLQLETLQHPMPRARRRATKELWEQAK